MEDLDLEECIAKVSNSLEHELDSDAGRSTGLTNQDRADFEWIDESRGQGQSGIGGVSTFDQALTSLESWRNRGRKLEPETNEGHDNLRHFDGAATHVLDNPETYATTYFHGTANDAESNTPLDDIIDDGILRASNETGNSETGEHGNLPNVSVSAAPIIARFYAETSTPTLEDVQESVENDILGRRMAEDEKSKDKMEKIIYHRLRGSDPEDWRYRGKTLGKMLEQDEWSQEEVHEYDQQRRQRYGYLLSRLDSLKSDERLEPVVFGFGSEALKGEVFQAYPLHKNELIENNLSEVQAQKVDLKNASLFVPMDSLEDYSERYGDKIKVGTIEGLTALHMAQNKDTYMEEHYDLPEPQQDYGDGLDHEGYHDLTGGSGPYEGTGVEKKHKKFRGTSVWAGHTMEIHYGAEQDEFDLQDPTKNPYALDLIDTR
jgi:hypothetical protein